MNDITPLRLIDSVRSGDRVTTVNRFGQKQTGRAVMRSSAGGWVLNMGGQHGTPGLADDSNTINVIRPKSRTPKQKLDNSERYGRVSA